MMVRNSIALSWLIVLSSSSACGEAPAKSASTSASSGGETSNDVNEGVDEAPDVVDDGAKHEAQTQHEATGE